MQKIKFLIMSLFLMGAMSCTHLLTVSTSSIPTNRSRPIEVETSKLFFFLLNFNNAYVNELVEDLANKCPRGKVQGIITKKESIVYFPLIEQESRISAHGYCVK